MSRKIIHIGTGPLFVLCWPLFPVSPTSRYLATCVPLAITIQFILVGTGVMRDEATVQAMSRTGDRSEILRGPLFYGLAFILLTGFYWYDSPTGIVALMLLSGGDGLADVIGRRFGKRLLSWNSRKSWMGTLAMFLGGFSFAAAVLSFFVSLGYFPGPWFSYLPSVLWIAIACTAVESLPIPDVDNLTIPLAAIVLGSLIF